MTLPLFNSIYNCWQKRLLDSFHLHFQNRLQSLCHHLIPTQETFYHPLNLTLTNLLNNFTTNIQGQRVKLLKQSFRNCLVNALHTTQSLFSVTLDSVTPTSNSAFLANITVLQNTPFASLITLREVVHAIYPVNVININCYLIKKVQLRWSKIGIFNQFEDTDINTH